MRPLSQVAVAAVTGAIVFFAAERVGASPSSPKRTEADWFLDQGRGFYKAKQYVRAREMLERCTGSYPKVAECHLLLGATYGRLGMGAEGSREYVTFLDLAPASQKAGGVRAILAGHVSGTVAAPMLDELLRSGE